MASRLRYRWTGTRYRDLRTGRFVSAAAVRRAIDQTIRAEAQRAKGLADDLRAGRISVDRWELEMRAMIRETHLYSAAAARGGFGSMDDAAYGQVGGVVAEQDRFFDRFAADVRSGAQRLDGRLGQRAALYVEAGRTTHERAHRDVEQDRGQTEERNILNDHAKHCSDCPGESERGWVPIGTLTLPGTRSCLGNCRCRIEYREGEIVTTIEEQVAITTEEEIFALDRYTQSHYGQINRALRWGDSHELVPALDALAAKRPTAGPLVVYRGVGQGNPVASLDVEELRKLTGTVIDEPGFMSTSTDAEVAVTFTSSATPVVLEVHVPKGTRAIVVAKELAKELADDLAAGRVPRAAAKENEIILARGYRFRVGEVIENAFPSQFFGGLARHKLILYLIP